jgi:hypothetical protein
VDVLEVKAYRSQFKEDIGLFEEHTGEVIMKQFKYLKSSLLRKNWSTVVWGVA